MDTKYLDKEINIKEVLKVTPFNPHFVENNEKQISDYEKFLLNDEKIFLVNGFSGAGKTMLTHFILSQISADVYVLNYTCFENTILDDMLLSFFETFRKYTIMGKFAPPKLKVENFTQKINSYINSATKPILIVLDSFDLILKENKTDIINFIKHVASIYNVKIIITSRKNEEDEFAEIKHSKTTVLPLSKNLFEKYLKDNGIKNIGILSNELYKQTRGYYNYINLCLKIMNLRNYNIGKFLEAFSKSGMSFTDFILRDMVNLIDPVSLHLFRLLAVMRVPLHENLLRSVHLYGPDRIKFYVDNSLIYTIDESFYLPDFYRDIIEHQIPENVMLKLHKACVNLYNTQLPLKPLERDLKLSRQTMRNEIEYHSLFIPQKPKISRPALAINMQQPVVDVQSSHQEEENVNNPVEVEEHEEDKIENINFIFEDETLLTDIAGSIKDFVTEKVECNTFVEESNSLGLTQLLNMAKEEEAKYNYKYAIILYQNALTKNNDDNYDKFLPTIYLKLANVYKHTSQWYESLEYLTKAQDYYVNVSDNIKVAEVKLLMANVYFVIYKQDNAKYILNELDSQDDLPEELRARINLSLGKICANINEEYAYYNKALSLAENTTDKMLKAELYYRFAGVNDQKDNTKAALSYYKKCIDIEPNSKKNKFLSKALANMADLLDEAGNSDTAVKYYAQSMKIDSETKNYNGLYQTSRRLADIYSGKDSEKSLKYLEGAYNYAKKLKEAYYIADIAYEIGNYYLLRKDFKNSLKYMQEALNIARESLSKDDTARITSKIEYINKYNKG